MGNRRPGERQASIWVASAELPRSAGHPFYERLNRVLDEAGFDAFLAEQCTKFYADGVGRPSLAPGRYFRMLLLGCFEGLDSEHALAWRAADSLNLRQFLDLALEEGPPDHSTVSRTRRRIGLETHRAVFNWVLQRLADAGLLRGTTVGIDATTLEANAALRSIRRDSGEGYDAFLRGLAAASGIPTPTRAELARLDRKRLKKGSNDDRAHPQDPDAKITKLKDGRTRLAHKAEYAVDLETVAVVRVTVLDADSGDTTTMVETLITAAEQVEAVLPPGGGLAQVVADNGYHSNPTVMALAELGLRSYVFGAGPRTAPVVRQRCGPCRPVCQPPSDTASPRAAPAPPARRTARTSSCPSLRDRPTVPRASAGSRQHPQASPRARLRSESGPAHAPADGRRDASKPLGPRLGTHPHPDRSSQPLLELHAAPSGGRFVRPGRDRPLGRRLPTPIPHATSRWFCHRLLAQRRTTMSLRTPVTIPTLLFALCIAPFGVTHSVLAQSGHALTAEERLNALEIEAATWSPDAFLENPPADSFARTLAETPRAIERESFIVAVTPVGSESTARRVRDALADGPASGRRALVTRYEYATGLTIRTWVNLSTREVLAVRRDLNYPAPLAPQELARATQLVEEHDAEIREIARARADEVEYIHMVPANSNWLPSRAGHRLVLLWLSSPVLSQRYLVDLSRAEVIEFP